MTEEDEEFRRLVRRDTGGGVDEPLGLVLVWLAFGGIAGLLSTAGPWWRVLGASLIIAMGVVILWWQRAQYAVPDWLAILAALGRGRPRPLADVLRQLLSAWQAWKLGAITIVFGLILTWNAIQLAVEPAPPVPHVRRTVLLVSSPLGPGPLADLGLDAARRWPSLVRHDLQLDLPESHPLIASIPGMDAKDSKTRRAAHDDARALDQQICAWSQRYPEIKFALIHGECRGERCKYRGHVCQNDMPLAGSDGGPDGATELLKHLGVKLPDDLITIMHPSD